MNPAQLLEHFDRISEAPDAVARLRRLILGLAVRGKLVEQYSSDEPAAELLKRIQAEKVLLLKEGKIKESKVLNQITATALYKLPTTWQWVPLGVAVNSHLGGSTPSKNNSTYWDGDIYWASVKDIGKGKYVDETIDRITEAGLADSSSNLIPPGNLIVVTRMGLGKISINRIPIAINQDLRALSLCSLAAIDYYYNFFKTHGFEGSGLTVKGIKVEELLNIPFPLPPLAEQHRIVAKIDELMALCDQLEAAKNEREARRDRLVAASLHRIGTAPAVADEAATEAQSATPLRDAARFHLDHLPRLTTRPEHIKQLRQTILNLAVRGRLVSQDPNDEPAAGLLKRIGVTGIKMEAPSLAVGDKQIVQLPVTWACIELGRIATVGTGTTPSRGIAEFFTPPDIPWVTSGETSAPYITKTEQHVSERAFKETSLKLYPKGTLLVAMYGQGKTRGQITELCIEATTNQACAAIVLKLEDHFHRRFIKLYFQKIYDEIRELAAGGAQPNLNVGKVKSTLIPLPPLAEQHRIVAKVDELMALCDQLEAQLTATQTDSRRLLEAVLHEALAPALEKAA